jgi:hypothetical protein
MGMKDDRLHTGSSLLRWAKLQEQRYSFGFCRYITGYGRLNDFPGRMNDWAEWQAQIAYEEGKRRLARQIGEGGDGTFDAALDD